MFRIISLPDAGDPIPVNCTKFGTETKDLEAGFAASKKYAVCVRYVPVAAVDELTPQTEFRPQLKGRAKKVKQDGSNEKYFLLDREKILGYPGGGFNLNKTTTVTAAKIPPPTSAAFSLSAQMKKNENWSFDFKSKKWIFKNRDDSESNSSSSSSDSDSSSDSSDSS